MTFLAWAGFSFFAWFVAVPFLLGIARFLNLYTVVGERQCQVYVLFGKVRAVIDEPGLHLLWLKMGPLAFLVRLIGTCQEIDLRLDQEYLRSQPVNSEEGAPMGIGLWYEMYISDPVAYLFKNVDPRGSLRANLGNATVRCLSNLKLDAMLADRHAMSRVVREEVSDKSRDWGYELGSVYIRKVHFRDRGMIHQIQEKVVNRLRQVTGAILQDGVNQVSLISSTAERKAAAEFARAAAMRPAIVGQALQEIAQDREVSDALFAVLECQRLLANDSIEITLVPGPPRGDLIKDLVAAEGRAAAAPAPTATPRAR